MRHTPIFLHDIKITPYIADKIVNKFFNSSKLENISPLRGGVFNTSYLLNLKDGLKIVLKISPPQDILIGYEHKLMHAEYLTCELCHRYGLPLPNIYFVDDSFNIIDRIYMLSEYIPGVSLNNVSATTDSLYQCYKDAGRAIRKMHAISGLRFGRLAIQINNGGFDTWGEAIIYELDTWLKIFSHLKLIPDKIIDAIKDIFKNYTSILNKIESPYLAHGDLWIGNILINSKNAKYKFRAIIDADHAIFGDPEIDFFYGKTLNDAFSKGYAKKLNSDWEAFIRRRLYMLLFTIKQCYIYQYILCDSMKSEEQKQYIYRFLNEFSVNI